MLEKARRSRIFLSVSLHFALATRPAPASDVSDGLKHYEWIIEVIPAFQAAFRKPLFQLMPAVHQLGLPALVQEVLPLM